MNDEISRSVLRTWAHDAAAFAAVLADQDPSWGSESFSLAGGRVVLCGAGMYVNRALAVGLDGALSEACWRRFEERCEVVGVVPAFEVSASTAAQVQAQLVARSYEVNDTRAVLFCGLDHVESLPDPNPAIVIVQANSDLLPLWQTTSAAGWGHVTPAAKRANDAFARAAAVTDHLYVALDSRNGRPVGCASLTVSDRIATLGGMSTLQRERGRGVQAALIIHRLRTAFELGCEIATSSTQPDSVSERNLFRHGFERRFVVETYARRLTTTPVGQRCGVRVCA